ncbi:hypothetical protein D3C77_609990 [compost metagenome]
MHPAHDSAELIVGQGIWVYSVDGAIHFGMHCTEINQGNDIGDMYPGYPLIAGSNFTACAK